MNCLKKTCTTDKYYKLYPIIANFLFQIARLFSFLLHFQQNVSFRRLLVLLKS